MPAKGAASRKDYLKYKAYYIGRETSTVGKKKRVERAQARAEEIKKGALDGPRDPRTVDHRTPLDRGGGNTASNLRVVSATANRRKYDH